MAKVQLTESQITNIVESATREALSRILSEGAGWDTFKAGFKMAKDGDMEDVDGKKLKSYVKDGENVNYDTFKHAKKDYEGSRMGDKAAQKAKKQA